MRHPAVLLLSLALCLQGCPNPEAEAGRLEELATQAVLASRQAEATSYREALAQLDTAASALAIIAKDYPKTQVQAKLAQAGAKLGELPLAALKGAKRAQLQGLAEAEASPLRCAAGLAHSMERGPWKVATLLKVAEALLKAGQRDQAKPLLQEATEMLGDAEPHEGGDAGGGGDMPSPKIQRGGLCSLWAQGGWWPEARAMALADGALPGLAYHAAALALLAQAKDEAWALVKARPYPKIVDPNLEDSQWLADGAELLGLAWGVAGQEAEAKNWLAKAEATRAPRDEDLLPWGYEAFLARLSPAARYEHLKDLGTFRHQDARDLAWLVEGAQAAGQGAALKARILREMADADTIRGHFASGAIGGGEAPGGGRLPDAAITLTRCGWMLHRLGHHEEGLRARSQAKAILAQAPARAAEANPEGGGEDFEAMAWGDAKAEWLRTEIALGQSPTALDDGVKAAQAIVQDLKARPHPLPTLDPRSFPLMALAKELAQAGRPGSVLALVAQLQRPEHRAELLVAVGDRPWEQEPGASEAALVARSLHALAGQL